MELVTNIVEIEAADVFGLNPVHPQMCGYIGIRACNGKNTHKVLVFNCSKQLEKKGLEEVLKDSSIIIMAFLENNNLVNHPTAYINFYRVKGYEHLLAADMGYHPLGEYIKLSRAVEFVPADETHNVF